MNRLEQRCLDRGVRINGKRRVILDVLAEADDHPSVDDVYRRVALRDRNISIATVYRMLNRLAGAGLLVRLELGDGRARYEEANTGRHEHLIDVQSGAVLEFHEPDIEQLVREAARRLGYNLIDYRLELFGQPPGASDTRRAPEPGTPALGKLQGSSNRWRKSRSKVAAGGSAAPP